jgi:hypothetical protein
MKKYTLWGQKGKNKASQPENGNSGLKISKIIKYGIWGPKSV